MNNYIKPIITVTVPTYNVEKYLQQCIKSVVEQNYSDIEILLIDDGSTDASGTICDVYAKQDSRIKIVHKSNGGLSDARNVGIDLSIGDYLSFIDSDDYVSKDFLELLLNSCVSSDCKMSVCSISTIDECNTINDEFYKPYKENVILNNEDKFEILKRHSAWNKLYKRQLFENIRYPVGKLYEDLYVFHYILDKVDKVGFVTKNLYKYRIRKDSIMSSKYSFRSTDIIWGYYDRALFYDRQEKYNIADEAYLWVYSRTAIAFSHLDSNIEENRIKLKEIKELYNSVLFRMISSKTYNIKQKIRCLVLYVSPTIHEFIYHTKDMAN